MTFFSCKTAKLETKTEQPKTEIITSEFPQKIGFVNDFENIFTEEEINFLGNILVKYENDVNREITVITIDSVPENMEFNSYAVKISDNWKVGITNNGTGLTVLLSKTLRKVRISTTDKTRDLYLSDKFCKKVIDQNMIPEFKKGKYYDGLLLGLNELIRKWL